MGSFANSRKVRKHEPKKRAPLLPKPASTGESLPGQNVFNMTPVTMEVDDLLAETETYEKEKAFAVPVSKAKTDEVAFKKTPLYKEMKAQAEEDKRELAELRNQVAELETQREDPAVSAETKYHQLWVEQKARIDRLEKLLTSAGERGNNEKLRADQAERRSESLTTEVANQEKSIKIQTERIEELEKASRDASNLLTEGRKFIEGRDARVAELEKELEQLEEELDNVPRQVENADRLIAKPRGKLGKLPKDKSSTPHACTSQGGDEKKEPVISDSSKNL